MENPKNNENNQNNENNEISQNNENNQQDEKKLLQKDSNLDLIQGAQDEEQKNNGQMIPPSNVNENPQKTPFHIQQKNEKTAKIKEVSELEYVKNYQPTLLKAAKVYFVMNRELNFSCGRRVIAEFFHLNESQLKRAIESCKKGEEIGLVGRHPSLSKEEKEELKSHITNMANLGLSLKVYEALDFANKLRNERAQIKRIQLPSITSAGWMYKFLKENGFVLTSAKLMEHDRRIVTKDVIKNFFDKWQGIYQSKKYPQELIFNMDESHVDWSDSTHIKVIVPKEGNVQGMREDDRIRGHISIIVTICADGTHLDTALIVQRKTLAHEMFEDSEMNEFRFCFAESGFINKYIFFKWVEKILIPGINAKRRSLEERALLISDGHSSRINLEALEMLKNNNIDLLVLPSHSTHILQPLDVGVFSSFKIWLRKQTKSKELKSILEATQKALYFSLYSGTVKSSFARSGMYPLDWTKIDLNPRLIDINTVNEQVIEEELQKQREENERNEQLEKERPKTFRLGGDLVNFGEVKKYLEEKKQKKIEAEKQKQERKEKRERKKLLQEQKKNLPRQKRRSKILPQTQPIKNRREIPKSKVLNQKALTDFLDKKEIQQF